jgi:hypothetical protein
MEITVTPNGEGFGCIICAQKRETHTHPEQSNDSQALGEKLEFF